MTGKQILFTARGKAELLDCEIQPPEAGEVLIECDFSAVSAGTERANLVALPNTAGGDTGFPVQPGYSGSGRIIDVGPGVTTHCVGDRVIINWGGHRSHFVKKAETVTRIEGDRVDQLDAAFIHITSFSLLGVRKLQLEVGESAMVAGLGLLGIFAVQFARISGTAPVLAADFDPARRELARKLGADFVFDPAEADYPEAVKEATGGRGVNAIVEVTGSDAALRQSLECVAWEGRISLLGCTRVSDVGIDFYQLVHRRGVALIGAHTFTRPKLESRPGGWTEHDDYVTIMKLLAAKRFEVRPVISEVVSPAEAPRIYGRLAEMKNPPLGIAFDWRKL